MLLARLLQCVFLLLMAAGGPATAAAVKYGTYYDETKTSPGICNTSLCTIYFSETPGDKLLLVTHVACTFTTPFPVTNLILGVNTAPTSGAIQREYPLQLPQPVVYSNYYYMQISHPVNFLIGQGRYPFVQAQTGGGGGNWGIECTISGSLVTPIT